MFIFHDLNPKQMYHCGTQVSIANCEVTICTHVKGALCKVSSLVCEGKLFTLKMIVKGLLST